MMLREFGSTGVKVPVIGQGTWNFPERGKEREEAKAALKKGVELGMVHIDTAELYGKAEEVIAEAIEGMPRERLFIVSKVMPSNASYKGTIAACEKSLQRLRTDYLDCYLLHWPGNHPIAETMGALEQLQIDGKIRSLGVSNFDTKDLDEAVHSLTKARIACNQVLYNLHDRGIERKLMHYCHERFISIVGYTPFAQKSLPGERSKEGAALSEVARKHGATIRQVILSFLIRNNNTFAIPKASKTEHIVENSKAGDLVLDAEDVAKIDAVYPAPKRDVPLGVV